MRAACGVRRGAPPVDGAHLLHVGKRRRPLSGHERWRDVCRTLDGVAGLFRHVA